MLRPRLLLLLAVPALVGAGGWLGWTGLQAQDSLEQARSALPAVRAAIVAGDAQTSRGLLAGVQQDAGSAYDRTHDPVWAVASAVPVLGEPLKTVRGITRAVDALTRDSLPALAAVADDLEPAALRPQPDRIDVDRLASAREPLQTASTSLRAQDRDVRALPASWLPQVADARSALLAELDPLAATSRKASLAAELLPPMLGAEGPRRYFLGFQNPAEARGTGGLLSAFAVVSAVDGRVAVDRVGANYQLPTLPAVVPGLDPEFEARYASQGATQLWVNANVSPDFPEVARTWRAMWRAGTGQELDGAIAVDPTVLAAVMEATGPLDVPEIGTVSAEQLRPLVLVDQYRLSQDTRTRKDAMLGVGTAVIDALFSGKADSQRLADELSPLGGSHVKVESADPQEQALLRRGGLAGDVSATDQPFAQAVTVNSAGGKLDTYLDSALAYRVVRCDGDGRTVEITSTLTNTAPASGLAPYVVLRADSPPYPTVPGQNRTDLRVLTTKGATLTGARLDGKELLAPELGVAPETLPGDAAEGVLERGTQAGRPSFGLVLELPPGATSTLVLTLEEPASAAAPLLPLQGSARTPTATADVTACR